MACRNSILTTRGKALVSRAMVLSAALALFGCSQGAPPQAAQTEATPAESAESSGAVTEVALDAASAARVRTLKLVSELAPETVEASGRITPAEDKTWRLGAVVEGRFEKVGVEVGDRVKKEQWLAGMHSHDIHDSRADYRRAISERRRAEESLAIAARQRDRAKRLLDMKAGSQEQADAAESEVVRAEAAVRAAEVEVERVRQHIVEVLQVAIDAPLEGKEGDDLIPIKAPEPGIVLKRAVTVGTVVTAGQELFVIADLSKVLMIAQVPEAFLGRLRIGQVVSVNVQSYPDRMFQGRIERIAEELDPETRTVQVRIAMANPGGALKPESYARASVPVGGSKPAVFLPNTAIQDVDGASAVFVQTAAGKFAIRPVAVGRSVNDRVEIVDGLAPGETVAVQGAFLLKSQLLKARLGG